MKRLLMMGLVSLVISGPAWGYEGKDGLFTTYGSPQCGEYLDVYAKTTLLSDGGYDGPIEVWKIFGWINGYLSAYNRYTDNEKSDVIGTMTLNDARRWIASWCRDNPTPDVGDALKTLIDKQ